jgi:2-oxoisovalerate dehydrogenase E1 component beta subunit
MSAVTYLGAIRAALSEEMERDPAVFLLGEDIGAMGGAFKVTSGMRERFGPDRIVDTPIAEAAIVGAAVGAAIMGMRPVAEMQFMDFITCGFNDIVNLAAKMHFRSGIPVPMVVRGPSGGGVRGGPFHSSNPEGWFVHLPGVKVVTPATAYDAKGLLKAAIRDDNPVIYFEHKYLYRRIKEELPAEDYVVPLGQAVLRREGATLSIVTYGASVHEALAAAEEVAGDGIAVEVLDLRTLVPLDFEAIARTVAKTGKVLVVHEDTITGGAGAEIAARIGQELFESLDGPVTRVAAPDYPAPYAPALEADFLPTASKIATAARQLAAY